MQMQRRPTLVLIDQNLDHPIHKTTLIKGTELIPRLRGLVFKGKIVMKTANRHATFVLSSQLALTVLWQRDLALSI